MRLTVKSHLVCKKNKVRIYSHFTLRCFFFFQNPSTELFPTTLISTIASLMHNMSKYLLPFVLFNRKKKISMRIIFRFVYTHVLPCAPALPKTQGGGFYLITITYSRPYTHTRSSYTRNKQTEKYTLCYEHFFFVIKQTHFLLVRITLYRRLYSHNNKRIVSLRLEYVCIRFTFV